MKNLLWITIFLVSLTAYAQEANKKVLPKGIITYERKVYLLKNIEDRGMMDEQMLDRMRSEIPTSVQTNYKLYFNQNSSYFTEAEEQDGSADKVPRWFKESINTNNVYANFEERKVIEQKTAMGKDLLIMDSLQHIPWKITDEFRTIAGYACRKATALVMDSLYIIAFYSDAIYPSTGPEHFFGLPGGILGVAIPRLHTSYMATSVVGVVFDDSKIIRPSKGQKTSFQELQDKLFEIGEGWRKGMGAWMSWSVWL